MPKSIHIPDADVTPSKSTFDKQIEQILTEANNTASRYRTILSALPDQGIPSEIDLFGYCAEQTVRFKFKQTTESGQADELRMLLETYPPMELVSVDDRVITQKPVTSLQQDELNQVRFPIAPVVLKQDVISTNKDTRTCVSSLRWWSQLAIGPVMVEAKGFSGAFLPGVGKAYTHTTNEYRHNHCSYYVRDFARLEAPLSSPLADWQARHAEFCKAVDREHVAQHHVPYFNGARTQMFNILCTRNRIADEAYSLEDAVRDSEQEAQSGSANTGHRKGRPLSELFDETMLTRIFDFLKEQKDSYRTMKEAHQNLGVATREKLCAYLSNFGGISGHRSTQTLLRRYVRLVLKSPVDVQRVHFKSRNDQGAVLQVSLTMEGTSSLAQYNDWYFEDIELQCSKDKPELTPMQLLQDIERAVRENPELQNELNVTY